MTRTLGGRFRREPFRADVNELSAKGIRFPFIGRGQPALRFSEEMDTAKAAQRLGQTMVDRFIRQDRGHHAEVVAIVEWVDDEDVSPLATKYSAVVNTYRSDA